MSRVLIGCGLLGLLLCVGWKWSLVAQDRPLPEISPKPKLEITSKEKPGDEEGKSLEEQLKPVTPLAKFMRKKLSASNLVLEGLVTENFGMIAKGAQQMEEMSQAEEWRVSNDVIYRQLSDDFRRIAQQLQKDAKKSTIDPAALTWIKTTMSCIECHKYTQGILVSGE